MLRSPVFLCVGSWAHLPCGSPSITVAEPPQGWQRGHSDRGLLAWVVTTTVHAQLGSCTDPHPLALRTGWHFSPVPSPPRRYYKETSGLMLDVGGYVKALEVPARSPPHAPGFLEQGACSVVPLGGLPLPLPRPTCSCPLSSPVLPAGPPSNALRRPLPGSVCVDHARSPPWAPAA